MALPHSEMSVVSEAHSRLAHALTQLVSRNLGTSPSLSEMTTLALTRQVVVNFINGAD